MNRRALVPAAAFSLLVAHLGVARAETIAAAPTAPITPPFPVGAPPVEVRVTVRLVVGTDGAVESATVVSKLPVDASSAFDAAALDAVRAATFRPSTRDGTPIRSRVDCLVAFSPPAPATVVPDKAVAPPSTSTAPSAAPATTNEPDEDYAQVVEVRGQGWSSPRGVGDVRIKRELLEASPRQQTSEMLSAAPGFFVDHEDGEGIGNDVYLRGFDLDHGSGVEMRLGSIPINIPTHVLGQGYADVNFVIPEVVRSIRVLEGPYDPRQGDAAIVGSAIFDLGVPDRGYLVKSSFGSFDQVRLVGVAAPRDADEETFAAVALRSTAGYGQNRAGQSASANAQYAIDLGAHDRLRFVATAYGARTSLAGVVRQDDVDAGRIGYFDSYPYFAQGQSVQSERVVVGADFDHVIASGARFEVAPWFMWTDLRSRQNYTGALETSQLNPSLSGLGDLFELANRETAAGLTSRFHTTPVKLGASGEVAFEPGLFVRAGHTDQTKSLLDPTTLNTWDRRLDAGLDTFDAGAYLDLDVRLWRKLHLSGGPRADLLVVSVDDHLAGVLPPGASPAVHGVEGVAAGPRATLAWDATPEITPALSYGEGFRSLDVQHLAEGAAPYSKVRSMEAGFRAHTRDERWTTTLAVFQTWVGNELVFEPAAGGLETENASVRRGVVSSVVARPTAWFLASSSLSVTEAKFDTLVVGVGHDVPSVPPILFRLDATATRTLGALHGTPVVGRVGAGYTFLSGRHLTDAIVGPVSHVLNAKAAVRWGVVEVGVDGYNLLDLRYADDAQYYVSNWSLRPGQQPASPAIHVVAAPPLAVLGSVTLHL